MRAGLLRLHESQISVHGHQLFLSDHLLQIGNDKTKEATTNEIKDYYNNNDFDKDDIYDIAIDTTKEDELFDYADIDKFYTKDNNFDDLER